MLISTKAFVFSSLKYSEADLIVTCFTENVGIQSYMLRGILKSKKGALKASYFQPLMQLDLVATHKNKGNLEYIREAKIRSHYQTLHTDFIKTGVIMFLSEMLKNCIKEEEQNIQLYNFLEEAFLWLDQNSEIANFHIYFLLQLSSYLGFSPDASTIGLQWFNISEGVFEATKLSDYSVQGQQIQHFKSFFGINFDGMRHIKLTKNDRLHVLDLLLLYYQLHVEGYKKPKSLLVLKQLNQ